MATGKKIRMEPHIAEIVEKFGLNPDTDMYEYEFRSKDRNSGQIRVTGSTWIIKHRALVRVAMKCGIEFGLPQILEKNLEAGRVVFLVEGTYESRRAWSTGEVSPKNSTSVSANYPFAMAEKRAKDRVALELLGIHGYVYSEEEADEFKKQQKAEDESASKHQTQDSPVNDAGLDKDDSLDLACDAFMRYNKYLCGLNSSSEIIGWLNDNRQQIRKDLDGTTYLDKFRHICKETISSLGKGNVDNLDNAVSDEKD